MKTKIDAEAPTKPTIATIRRASPIAADDAREPRNHPARDQAADAAEQQRQPGQHGAHLHARAARFAQIRGQPGDVEIPAVRERDVLQAKQPDRALDDESTPQGVGPCAIALSRGGGSSASSAALTLGCVRGSSRNQR